MAQKILAEGFISSACAAAILGRSSATVSNLVKRGVLTPFAVGCANFFNEDEVREVARNLDKLDGRRRKVAR